MALQKLFLGTTTGDKTGTGAKSAGQMINANFEYLEDKIDNRNKVLVNAGFTQDSNEILLNAGWQWVINGTVYSNPFAVMIDVPVAAAGLSRLDNIVATTSNTFTRLPGVESATPVAPIFVEGTIVVAFAIINDTALQDLGNVDSEKLDRAGYPGTAMTLSQETSALGENLNTRIDDFSNEFLEVELPKKLNITDYNQHFKGVYLTEAALFSAHPTASVGDYAQVNEVGATDVVNYNWDAEESIWVKNEVAGSGATNTDELPEGTTNLYFTVARFLANLTYANVIAALGFTPSTAPNNAQKNSDITKAEIEAKLTGEITSHTHVKNDVISYALSAPTGDLVTGDVDTFHAPYNFTLVNYWIAVKTAPTVSSIVVDLKKSGTSITSTKAAIDATENTSLTGTAPVLVTTTFVKGDPITPSVFQVGSSETGKSLKIYLEVIKS